MKDKDLDKDLQSIQTYWDTRAGSFADDCEKVDSSKRSQLMRFEAFLQLHPLSGKSVLDVGCGVGDLFAYLQAKHIDTDYTGFDISPVMVARCNERFPNATFESGNFLDWEPTRRFDYAVAVGIHNNVRTEHNKGLLKAITKKQFDLCSVAAHVSILTDRYEKFAPHMQAWRAEEVLELALDITPYVLLRHDYLPHDFSVILYHEPLIDTRKDLLDSLRA
ncbi:MAG: class I SAM-dependent methyltransferase [Betaproteobacteria bacterium]|nr:class I SAM-dependent methyltransferase [Betaproteobacteria bacterium]